jgi:hypothetical protein
MVGEGEVLDGRGTKARETDVGQDEKCEDVDRQAWDRLALLLSSQGLEQLGKIYLIDARQG